MSKVNKRVTGPWGRHQGEEKQMLQERIDALHDETLRQLVLDLYHALSYAAPEAKSWKMRDLLMRALSAPIKMTGPWGPTAANL